MSVQSQDVYVAAGVPNSIINPVLLSTSFINASFIETQNASILNRLTVNNIETDPFYEGAPLNITNTTGKTTISTSTDLILNAGRYIYIYAPTTIDGNVFITNGLSVSTNVSFEDDVTITRNLQVIGQTNMTSLEMNPNGLILVNQLSPTFGDTMTINDVQELAGQTNPNRLAITGLSSINGVAWQQIAALLTLLPA